MPLKPKKVISLTFTVLILLLTIPATAILATWNTLPGDTLYPVKRGLEKTALAITPKSLLETKLHLAFLDRRTQEATIAINQNPTDQQILDDIITEAKAAQISTINLKSKDQKITASIELIEKVNQASNQLSQIQSTISSPPPSDNTQPLTYNLPTQTTSQTTPQTAPKPDIDQPIPPPTTTQNPEDRPLPEPQTPSSDIPIPLIQSPPTPSPVIPTPQPITQTQQQLEQIADQIEEQLETQTLNQEQQQKLETIKKEKRPKPSSNKQIDQQPPKSVDSSAQCWNRVIEHQATYDGYPSWSNGCRGRITNSHCTMAIVRLTESELNQYNQWIADGKPNIPGCSTPSYPNQSCPNCR